MTNDLPINDPQQTLAAFADGELDGEHNLQVLRQMAQDPGTAARVAQHQQLRHAVAKAMDDPALTAPAELRQQIRDLAASVPVQQNQAPQQPSAQGSPVLAVIGRWLPTAVAALFFIGALVTLYSTDNPTHAPLITQANVINASLIDQFGTRHFKCSRNITPMADADKFPKDIKALPGVLSDYFDQSVSADVLDLSSLGYRYDMAGICIVPGQGAVHLIYQSTAPNGSHNSLSLWLRPFEQGSGIQPDRLYTAAEPKSNFPMLVWRHGNMVYYLVGDSYDAVEQAFDAISQNQG